jgi:hypothetical protein
LTEDFFKMLKEAFDGREIIITVEETHDETAYLLADEANRENILAAVEAIEQGRHSRSMTLEEAEVLAE